MMRENNKAYTLGTNIFGRPKLSKITKKDKIFKAIIALALIVTISLLFMIEYKWEMVDLGILKKAVAGYLRIDLVSPVKKLEMFRSLANTLALAFLATLLGLIGGLVVSVFAARNISPKWLAGLVSSIASVIRAIPTIVWVLIFVSSFGLTATTAVVGMVTHTFSFFVKSLSESYEEVSIGTIEALRSCGANKIQIILGAIIPSALTRIIAWIGLRLEQNFATAVIIGPAVGVPGTIGTDINNAARTAEYPIVGFGILLILITAIVLEIFANRARKKKTLN